SFFAGPLPNFRAMSRPKRAEYSSTCFGQPKQMHPPASYIAFRTRTGYANTQFTGFSSRLPREKRFHFGEQTVKDMGLLLAQSEFGQRVNSVFGEGANPRLRKIRDALDLLRLPTEELLQHGSPRLVYGVRLVENVREYLLGMDKRPRYVLPQRNAAAVTQEI